MPVLLLHLETAKLPRKFRRGALRIGKNLWMVAIILLAICGGLGTFIASRQAEQRRIAAEATRAEEIKPIIALAEKQALANSDVTAAVGEKATIQNAKADVPAGKDLNLNDTSIQAELKGDKGTAKLSIKAKQADAAWKLVKLEATLSDGKKLEIELPSEEAPPELNFDAN